MNRFFKILASCRTEGTSEAIQDALSPVRDVRVELRNGAISDMIEDFSKGHRADMIILDVDLAKDNELQELTELIERVPTACSVIATSQHASIDKVRLLMRLGLADFVPQPIVPQDLLNSISVAQRNALRVSQFSGPRHRAAILAVTGAVGGMGATSLAVNIAYAFANEKKKPRKLCLVDLDLQNGMAGLYLDVKSETGLMDCVIDPSKLDLTMVKSVMHAHKSGFDILPAIREPVSFDDLPTRGVELLIDVLSEEYDVVIIDLPPVWAQWSPAVLRSVDGLVVVTQLTVAALKRTQELLSVIAQCGLDDLPIRTICNRHESRLFSRGLSIRDAEKSLGQKFLASLPDEFELMSESQNQGQVIGQFKRGTKIEKEIRRIATQLFEEMRTKSAAKTVNISA